VLGILGCGSFWSFLFTFSSGPQLMLNIHFSLFPMGFQTTTQIPDTRTSFSFHLFRVSKGMLGVVLAHRPVIF
jgi:hypothetical protein